MKKILTIALMIVFTSSALAQHVWVSDEIEAPLRESAQLNAKIVAMLPAGRKVTVLEQNKDFIKIKSADGKVGWLSSYYVLRQASVHERFEPTQKALAKAEQEIARLSAANKQKDVLIQQLKTDVDSSKKTAGEVAERAKSSATGVEKLSQENELLKKELGEQSEKMKQLAVALESEKQKASDARTRYLSLAKVSENAVEIDKQNRSLQKKAVQFEQELQRLKTDNLSLTSEMGNKKFVLGVLTVLGGILVGYILSVMMPPAGRRRRSSSGF